MFWDLVIRRLHSTFGEAHPHGPGAAFRILALAYQQQRFNPVTLRDLSILLLVLTCPSNSALRARADQEFLRRGLHLLPARTRMGEALRSANPSPPREWFGLMLRGTPHQRALAADLVLRHFGPRLAVFLGRLLLTDAAAQRAPAVQGVVQALGRFARIPPGTVDLACYLYRRVLGKLPAAAPPAARLAPPLPAWLAALADDERRFLTGSLALAPADRTAVLLSLYAGLSARQIACVLSVSKSWTEDQVIGHLAPCWENILRGPDPGQGLNGY